mmetsp:Transcript_27936/g.39279  ORF Transcript_27936/g.39279 Transcript_27936/m.39279 type:complete len:89 (-) Transcript_27936:3-269(-)
MQYNMTKREGCGKMNTGNRKRETKRIAVRMKRWTLAKRGEKGVERGEKKKPTQQKTENKTNAKTSAQKKQIKSSAYKYIALYIELIYY